MKTRHSTSETLKVLGLKLSPVTLTTVVRSKHPLSVYHCARASRCRTRPAFQSGRLREELPTSSEPASCNVPVAASRDSDIVFQLYAREIGPVRLLTPDEETVLARRVKKGDKAARERMIKANLRLVVKIARDFEGSGLPLLDLINEGNIGLMTAVGRFDTGKGAKLSTYAAYYIKQSMRRAIADYGRLIRLPVYAQEKLMLINRAEAQLHQVLGRSPTDEEISVRIRLPARKVRRLRTAANAPISLDASQDNDDGRSISEVVPDESGLAPDARLVQQDNHQLVHELMEQLPPRELDIVRRRFGFNQGPDKTLAEIGAELGLTRERIRQLQNSALRKLRAGFRAHEAPSVRLAA